MDDTWENPIWAALQTARGHKADEDTAPMPAMGDAPGDKLAMKMSQGLLAANPAAALGRAAVMEGGKALWDTYGPSKDTQQHMVSAMRDYISPPSYMTAPLRKGLAEGGRSLPMRLPYGQRWNEETRRLDAPQSKDIGFYGPLENAGHMVSEYSIDDRIGGEPVQYPTVSPNLSPEQLHRLMTVEHVRSLEPGGGSVPIPDDILDAAASSARDRLAAGKSPFWDQRVDPYPAWSPEQHWEEPAVMRADGGSLSDPTLPIPSMDSIRHALGIAKQIVTPPDPYVEAGRMVQQARQGDYLGALETGFGAMPNTGAIVYHGSPNTALKTISSRPGTRQYDNATSQLGAFFSPEEAAAKYYAGDAGRVYKADIDLAKPYEMPVSEFLRFQAPNKGAAGESLDGSLWASRAEELKNEAAALRQSLEAQGYTGVHIRGSKGDLREIASFADVPTMPGGIKAYHGSPHSFDRFSLDKIGTGEGAQAYGHGLYFAENEGVAKAYRDKLGMGRIEIEGRPVSELAQEAYRLPYGQQPTVSHKLAEIIDSYGDNARPVLEGRYPELLKSYDDMKAAGVIKEPGHMYEVNINAEPEHFLDWDKPLSEHPEAIRRKLGWTPELEQQYLSARRADDDALLAALEGSGNYRAEKLPIPQGLPPLSSTGQDIVRGRSVFDRASDIAKAEKLHEAGIPGIKYLDQGSRGAGEGSRNYVVFDDKLVDISRKYAEGGEVNELPMMAREHPDLEIADAMRLAKDYPTNDVWPLPGEARLQAAPAPSTGQRISNYLMGDSRPTPERRRFAEGVGTIADYALPVDPLDPSLSREESFAALPGFFPAVGAVKGKSPKAPAGPPPVTRDLTPTEQNFMDAWGGKHAAEWARQKQVQKLAGIEPTGKKTVGSAVPSTFWRDLYKAEGADAVLARVRKGEHLRPTGVGGYYGFPRTVTSPQSLGAFRKRLDQNLTDSAEAVQLADPERTGTWYDRAMSGQAATNEPHQLDPSLNAHAVYSAGVSPENELGFALKHHNSRALGEPTMAYRSAGMNTLDNAAAEGVNPELGDKIAEYRDKNDPRLAEISPFGVNDFRWAQSMEYTDKRGMPWKAAVSSTMHPVMDAETALLVDRANRLGLGGITSWTGAKAQELPWVYGKAQDLYRRGSTGNGRFARMNELEGRLAAVREANNTFTDYLPKHIASGTYEGVPGESTKHASDVLGMSEKAKVDYGNVGRWDIEPPVVGVEGAPTVGAGRRDVLYGAAGLRQLPTLDTRGMYRNMAGEWESNPAKLARPIVDFPPQEGMEKGTEGSVAPLTDQAMRAIERLRGVNDAQEAFAYNMPVTKDAAKGRHGILLDTMPHGEYTGTQADADILAALNVAAGRHGYGVTSTNRGVLAYPFSETVKPAERARAMRELGAIMPDAKAMPARPNAGWGPAIGKWKDETRKEVIPSTPYSGEATIGVLEEFTKLPQEVAQNVGESDAVRRQIRAKRARDEMNLGARGDIQNTRQFFADANWPAVVDLMRKGVPPAAALATLGYSANALADERSGSSRAP